MAEVLKRTETIAASIWLAQNRDRLNAMKASLVFLAELATKELGFKVTKYNVAGLIRDSGIAIELTNRAPSALSKVYARQTEIKQAGGDVGNRLAALESAVAAAKAATVKLWEALRSESTAKAKRGVAIGDVQQKVGTTARAAADLEQRVKSLEDWATSHETGRLQKNLPMNGDPGGRG